MYVLDDAVSSSIAACAVLLKEFHHNNVICDINWTNVTFEVKTQY